MTLMKTEVAIKQKNIFIIYILFKQKNIFQDVKASHDLLLYPKPVSIFEKRLLEENYILGSNILGRGTL